MITATEALNRLIDQNELFYDEMTDLMRQIMTGQLQPEIIAALLIGLRIKVETVSEIAAAATVMRDFATKVPVLNKHQLVDIVGTGGDQAHTFNISTTAMFVAAGAGARIAKHGGRAVSSSSGAADIRCACAQSLGCAHHFQYSWPFDQSCRCAQPSIGCVSPRLGRHFVAGVHANGSRTCVGGQRS